MGSLLNSGLFDHCFEPDPDKVWNPGERVPVSGVYEVLAIDPPREGEARISLDPPTFLDLIRGRRFPPGPGSGRAGEGCRYVFRLKPPPNE